MKSASEIPTAGPIRRAGNRIIVQQPNAVLGGYDFRGFYVSVGADGVSITDCLFDATGFFTVDQQSGSGLTVARCTFDSDRKPSPQHMAYINGRDGTLLVLRSTFKAPGSDNVAISRGLVEGCTMSDPWGRKGSHSDGITVAKTTGAVVIRANLIDWRQMEGSPGGINNCIRIASTSSVRGVTVEDNTLLGGTFSVYAGIDPSNKSATCERVTLRGNVADGWGENMGWLYPTARASDLSIEDNRKADGQALAA
jgi:hypothetical protein